MHLNGAEGVILRAGQGSWQDKKFDLFRADAEKVIPFGSYWYYDNYNSPEKQAELYASILGNNAGVMGAWLDLEDQRVGPYGTWEHWYRFIARFQSLQSVTLGIYTRASYINGKIPDSKLAYFGKFPLWIAHYGTMKPDIPKGWTTYLFHQYTDSGDGTAYGVGSKEIDLNRFNGTDEEFRERYGLPSYSSTIQAKYGSKIIEYRRK
jgi:GH25 family lysozyme M1 (1,4-beta-N-acetylmuramidase)